MIHPEINYLLVDLHDTYQDQSSKSVIVKSIFHTKVGIRIFPRSINNKINMQECVKKG